MARRKSSAPFSVVLNGCDVGALTKASSGAIGLRYAPTWLEEKNTIPVSLPLREDGYVGEPVIAVTKLIETKTELVRNDLRGHRLPLPARLMEQAGMKHQISLRLSHFLPPPPTRHTGRRLLEGRTADPVLAAHVGDLDAWKECVFHREFHICLLGARKFDPGT